ncbi:MAG: hypothetical protein O2856_19820, partial [Planctomycetota bacterium]|nr:hypothetical protein [Planctomycetota bacterium]
SATSTETVTCGAFLKRQASILASPASLTEFGGKTTSRVEASGDPILRAKENLIHVLMNHNDFITIR